MWPAGEGDDNERFLADLRALRDTAALEFDELAARAHYPSDVLKEAESGRSLPGLPILAAYVRACDGDVLEWEERWRRLGLETRADPSLPVRPAGASPAAVAGARAAVSVAPPDAYDPERIRAALRSSHGRSDHDGHDTATRPAPGRDTQVPAVAEPKVPESPATWSAGTSWDETASWEAGAQPGTRAGWDGSQPDGFGLDAGARWDGNAADIGGTTANGNHHVSHPADAPSGTADSETPDDAARAATIQRDPFSAAWLRDGEAASPPGTEPGWSDRAEAGPPPAAAGSWFTPRERTGGALPAPQHDAAPPQEHTGQGRFWTPSAAASGSPASDPPGAADRTRPASAQPAAPSRTTPVSAQPAAPSRTAAGPTVPPGPAVPPGKRRSDRLYPVRLLVVILVAALIGSILVLILR